MTERTRHTKSIRTRITIVTACAIFVTVVITAILGTLAIKEIAVSRSEQLLQLLCQTGQKNLNSYFTSVEQSVELVSSFVGEDLKSLDPEELAAHVDRTRSIFRKNRQ